MHSHSLLVSCLLVSGTTATLHAQSDYRWSGLAVTDNWNDENNWLNDSQGGIVSGFPSLSDIAIFQSSASVFNGQASELNIELPSTITLGRLSTTSTEIMDSIVNMGTLTFIQDSIDNNGSIIDQRLFIGSGSDVSINGSGQMLMNGTETGIEGAGILVSAIRNTSNHTIAGSGRFEDIRVVNEGVIRPSFGSMEFRFAEIQGEGLLDIASNGTLSLGINSLIHNTTVCGAPGALIATGFGQGTLQDVELQGEISYGIGSTSATTISGTIANTGTLTFIQDSIDNSGSIIDQHLFIESGTSATLAEDGHIVLNGSETGIQGANAMSSTLINGTNHTITGAGAFRAIRINNRGTIQPSFGTITTTDTVIDGTGVISIADNGTFEISSGATIENTKIFGVPNSTMSARSANGMLRNMTLEGNLTYDSSGIASITLEGTLTNTSTLSFAHDSINNSSSVIDRRFFVESGPGGPTVAGNGQLVLDGSETGIQGAGAQLSTLTHDKDHTITGDGSFRDVRIVNRGTITPSFGSISFANAILQGDGELQIASNGALLINGGAEIRDTTIHGSPGAVIDSNAGEGTIRNLTLTGELQFGRDSVSSTTLAGTITNNSHLVFTSDTINNSGAVVDQRFFVESGPGAASIEGNGRVELNGIETGFQGVGSSFSVLTNAKGHTITGHGTIRDLRVVNLGDISPSSGEMILTGSELQGAGVTQIASDGVLLLNSGSTANATTIHGAAGSILGSLSGEGTLRDVILSGELIYGLGALSSVALEGTTTNNSVLAFTQDSTNQDSNAIDQRFFIASGPAGASFTGNGRVNLNGVETGIQGEGSIFSTLTNEPDHTIAGSGTFEDIRIINSGTISPSGGERRITLRDSTLEIDSDGELAIQLVGLSQGQFSCITMTGQSNVELDGTLRLELSDGYTPSFGDSWTMLEGGMISGQFSQLLLPTTTDGLIYRIVYAPDEVRLVLTCDADFTGDGILNFFDVSRFLEFFNAQDPQSDLTRDGNFDFFDVSAFLGALGDGCS